jgi:hypothetical protein
MRNSMKKKSEIKTPTTGFSFKNLDIEVKKLLLDPNNYRFLDNRTFKKRIKTKFHLEGVQESTQRLLETDKSYQLDVLKKSIRTNGYVPMERVIVVPYSLKPGSYLVIEGNRRVAALKSLLKEDSDGITQLSASQRTSFSRIPCAVLSLEDRASQHAQRVIMGIRHIAGPKEWGAYQQALLVTELHDEENYDFSSIGDHLGISTVEAARRYRAMKALSHMEKDELYSESVDPHFYRLFHELVSLPIVRERFGWDSKTDSFSDTSKAREFFELIAPHGDEATEPKLNTYLDVRKLKYVIGNLRAEATLTDPNQPYSETLRIAESTKGDKDNLSMILADADQMLSSVGIVEIRSLTAEQTSLIDKLIATLNDLKRFQVNKPSEGETDAR